MPEEVGLPYRVHPVNIEKGEQFDTDFAAIAPNNKIPAIIDTDNGLRLMESAPSCFTSRRKTRRLWQQSFSRQMARG